MSSSVGLPAAYYDKRIVAVLGFLSAIILFFAAIHILYPTLPVDATILGLLTLLVFVWLFPFIKELALPGGFKITTRTLQPLLISADRIRQTAAPTVDKFVREVVEEPRWKTLIVSDPIMALAGLRSEIETRVKELVEKVAPGTTALRHFSMKQMVDYLASQGALTADEKNAVLKIVSIGNAVIHGEEIEPKALIAIGDIGELLLRVLDSKLAEPKP